MKDLFNGIAIVIDDELGSENALLNGIVNQIEVEHIPMVKYKALPDDEIKHFQNISFLILDWNLAGEGVQITDTLEQENINFIQELSEICFCPMFIFSNEDVNYIKGKLTDNGLYDPEKICNIFIQPKDELQNGLFGKLSEWLKRTPSVYVLKEWEKSYQECKNKLFSDFYNITPYWPIVMWRNFEQDGANKCMEMGELISRNLLSRMTPFSYRDEILNIDPPELSSEELRKVLEGERYLKKECLHDNIGTGDLFKEAYEENGETKYRYYLNIRAQCDLLRTDDINDTELYCLEGNIMKEADRKSMFSRKLGQFNEKVNHAIVPFLDGGQVFEFLFKDIKIKKWGDIKDNRIGRLLPPYTNRIQQRYALYMHRQGLPRIPNDIF
jgi:hypothetical protein